jgi:hypothetical protein
MSRAKVLVEKENVSHSNLYRLPLELCQRMDVFELE